MQKYTYPTSDLDDVGRLLSSLGSFWSRIYEAKDQLATYGYGSAQVAAQAQLNLLETVAAISRYEIPVYHTENWYPLVIRKSQLNVTPANYYRFDEAGLEFDAQPPINFDALTSRDFFAFKVPDTLVDAGQIYDRLLFPSIALTAGVDFVFDSRNNAILFALDPFSFDTALRQPIYEGDQLVDEEITLWLFKAKFDYQYVFTQFAYAINVQARSSENYKQLVNAVISGLLDGGASERAIDDALAAILDVKLAAGNETVELITTDSRGLIIATDKTVYRFSEKATPTVSVGDAVLANQQLVNAFSIIELNRGEVPTQLKALALDRGFTFGCFYGDLIFENIEVPLVVDENHPSGYTYVKFDVSGFPHDVQRFFDEIHARGIEETLAAAAQPCDKNSRRRGTLARLLDRRTAPDSEPVAANLPHTINPLKFLVENILRNNTAVVLINTAAMGPNRLGLHNIRHLRQLIPPHAALFFVYELSGTRDKIAGNLDVSDWPKVFKATEPARDVVGENYVKDKGAVIRVVGGNCHADTADSCHKKNNRQDPGPSSSSSSPVFSSSSSSFSSTVFPSSSSVLSSSSSSSLVISSSSSVLSSSSSPVFPSSSSSFSSTVFPSSSSVLSSSSSSSLVISSSSSVLSSSSSPVFPSSSSVLSSSSSVAADSSANTELYACVIPKFKYACVEPKFKYACVEPKFKYACVEPKITSSSSSSSSSSHDESASSDYSADNSSASLVSGSSFSSASTQSPAPSTSSSSGTGGGGGGGGGGGAGNLLFDRSEWGIGDIQEPYKTYLLAAMDRWEQFIAIDTDKVAAIREDEPWWNGIACNSLAVFENFFNGIDYSNLIGACSPTKKFGAISMYYALRINAAWANPAANIAGVALTPTQWVSVLTHELGHALGLGDDWANYAVGFWLGHPRYADTVNTYKAIAGVVGNKIPLEDTGVPGQTAGVHWENHSRPADYVGADGVAYPGVANELMIGALDLTAPPTKLSRLSLTALQDMGYTKLGDGEGDPTLAPPWQPGANLAGAEPTTQTPNTVIKLNCHLMPFDPPVKVGKISE